MKIHILSDLHNEFGQIKLTPIECDAVILAGDADVGIRGAQWAMETFKGCPIIYITGNHEYYGKKLPKINRQLTELSRVPHFHFLDRDELLIDNVRFLGCTLWTDFNLFGLERKQFAVYEAGQQMTDYRRIRLGEAQGYRKLRPADTIYIHHSSVRFLEEKLKEPFSGATVVITHHAPSPKSMMPEFQNDLISASYCNDLEWMIDKYQPELWIHGHIHRCFDYKIGKTRVLCNPRGYAPNEITEGFQVDLVVNV
jgi:predicted phosphodiesterase